MQPVTVILVSYNSAFVIGEAIASVIRDPLVAQVIVVDNASSDNTREIVRADFPQVVIVESPDNLGFGRANNLALQRTKTEFALLLNPDAALEPGALAALLEAATRHEDAALLAPLLHDEQGNTLASFNRDLFVRRRKMPFIEPEGDTCADFLSGAAWLLRMAAYTHVGGFDPALFFYCEDDDLCLRLRQAGYSLVLAPEARALHRLGKSSAPTPESERFRLYHFTRSRLYMERKYRGKLRSAWLTAVWFAKFGGKLIGVTLLCIPYWKYRYRARFAAVRDFMRGQ